jgi:hypothetical protein
LEDPECTKIKQLIRHKGFVLRMLGCSPISNECVSEGEGLRNEILSKTHHSPYIVHPRSIKKYKNEERSGLEFNTYLSSSSLQATFGCRLMKHFMDISVSRPCIGTMLEGDNIGRDNFGRKQR